MNFRKTTQFLAPACVMPQSDVYDIYPSFSVGNGQIDLGFTALAQRLAQHEQIILDGMVGVFGDDFRVRLTQAFAQLGVTYEWFDAATTLKPEAEIDKLIAPFLGGTDPLFGRRATLALRDFFKPLKLSTARRRIVYGVGAALLAGDGFLVYVDVPKNEIQFR